MNWIKLSNGYLVNLDKVQRIVPEAPRRVRFGGPMAQIEMEPPYLVFEDGVQVKILPLEYEHIARPMPAPTKHRLDGMAESIAEQIEAGGTAL